MSIYLSVCLSLRVCDCFLYQLLIILRGIFVFGSRMEFIFRELNVLLFKCEDLRFPESWIWNGGGKKNLSSSSFFVLFLEDLVEEMEMNVEE